MNQFNTKLDLARKRQKRSSIIVTLLAFTVLLAVLAFLTISRGTPIEVLPTALQKMAEIQVTRGTGFSVNSTLYSISSTVEITISAPGFQSTHETIGPSHLGKTFSVELTELPGHLTVNISNKKNNLSRTRWLTAEETVHMGPELDIQLPAGKHTITVDNTFYQLQEILVELQRGKHEMLTIDLLPIRGTAHIASHPTGATVFVDNVDTGTTPFTSPLAGGPHSLRVASVNYLETFEEISIERGATELRRMYQLERKKAKVSFNLTPEGGVLLVNGVITPDSVQLNSMVSHPITYKKQGYFTQTQHLTLKPDEQKTLSFSLKKEKGTVRISSSPPAKVFVGAKEYGMTPITLSLQAVKQKIFLRKTGYREVIKTLTPQSKSDSTVSGTLLTEYQARLQEAPREYTNSGGVKLTLFMTHDTFIMGAPRSEKGQRANEFQRKIHLSKPFYASLYEITNTEFTQFKQHTFSSPADAPVTSIGWQEAAAYCNWLSKKENLLPFYYTSGGLIRGFNSQADGYRMLSEAEWEWLARKSGRSRQTLFTWGNETTLPPQVANIADESAKGQVRYYVPGYNDNFEGVAPAGSFTVEPSGLYDQAGNVSEWVHDVYSIISVANRATETNPLGQSRGQSHVIKGANWSSGTITTLRPAFREGLLSGQDNVGFRIARYLYGGKNE